MATDDIADLLVQQTQPVMRYGQGKIISWDSITFANVIEWNGTYLEDLSVVGTTDALSYQPGQLVALHGMDASGEQAATQWWIAGRLMVPGTDNAAAIVDFMRGSLAKQISAEIFADRITIDTNDEIGTRAPDETYGDLTGTAVGPEVIATVSDAGVALVFLSAALGSSANPTAIESVGTYTSVSVSGATTVPASGFGALRNDVSGSASPIGSWMRATSIAVFDELNPGKHTFTMKYLAAGNVNGTFTDRSIAVIAL